MEGIKVIGIVGGLGPCADDDLIAKVRSHTIAEKDQEHLHIALLSFPGNFVDRTSFLLGETDINPAYAISDVAKKLEFIGADVIGIPCNTSHAPEIYNVIVEELRKACSKVVLINMVDEVVKHIVEYYPSAGSIGVLSTTGLFKAGVYRKNILRYGLNVIEPDVDIQEGLIHKSIYDPVYGIKSKSNPVTDRAVTDLHYAINHLINKGAEAIILGCTEIGLAVFEKEIDGCAIIDSTSVLARALIREAAPHKLKAAADELETWQKYGGRLSLMNESGV